MLRGLGSTSACFILIPMVLVLATPERVAAEREGIIQRPSRRESKSGSGLRDFLPKAGTIAKFEGNRTYKNGMSTKFLRTSYIDWRRHKGKEYIVRRYTEEEKFRVSGREVVQFNGTATTYEVTHDHIAIVSGSTTRQGAIATSKWTGSYEPPLVSLRWPLREGETWEQRILYGAVRTVKFNAWSVVKGEETVRTPVGTFPAWRIEQTWGSMQYTSWWAKGRWIVKWQLDGPNKSESGELVEFKKPPMW